MHGFEIFVAVLLLAILAIAGVLLVKHISLQQAVKDMENFVADATSRLHKHVSAVETSVTDAVGSVEKKVTDLAPKAKPKAPAKK